MTHRCHAPNCTATVPHEVFMCARHWRMVPKPLQGDLRAAWDERATDRHRSVSAEAIRVVGATEGGRMMTGIVPGMKALTIWQPWASLIMIGAKPWEFRRWNFADKPNLAKLIGHRIVIHAGAHPMKRADIVDVLQRLAEGESALDSVISGPFLDQLLSAYPATSQLAPAAAALGTAVIGQPRKAFDLFVDKVADSDRLDQHMYAWPMTDPQPFPAPVPASGAQGFWNWS